MHTSSPPPTVFKQTLLWQVRPPSELHSRVHKKHYQSNLLVFLPLHIKVIIFYSIKIGSIINTKNMKMFMISQMFKCCPLVVAGILKFREYMLIILAIKCSKTFDLFFRDSDYFFLTNICYFYLHWNEFIINCACEERRCPGWVINDGPSGNQQSDCKHPLVVNSVLYICPKVQPHSINIWFPSKCK